MRRVTLSGFPRFVGSHDHKQFETALQNSLLGRIIPDAPIVPRHAKVASLGSCFAEEISKALGAQNLDVVYVPMSERWNSAFAVDTFLAYVFDGTPLPDGFTKNNALLPLTTSEQIINFRQADLYILTFGMSLCWFNPQGQIVVEPGDTATFPGLKKSVGDRYRMVQTTVEQNEKAVASCVERIKRYRPNATVVMTLSPVPMMGVVSELPAIPANTVSKATLRLAIENVRQKNMDGLYYWPSYDIVNWYGNHIERAFGDDDRDARHVRQKIIDLIVGKFVECYIGADRIDFKINEPERVLP